MLFPSHFQNFVSVVVVGGGLLKVVRKNSVFCKLLLLA